MDQGLSLNHLAQIRKEISEIFVELLQIKSYLV